jgi:disulfide bond formation protein DsbB
MGFAEGTRFLGVLAVVAVLGAGTLLVVPRHPALAPVRQHAVALAGLVALVSTAGSLWLSEGVGLVPCTLCWVQRAAMYPLAVLLPLLALRPSRWGVRLTAALGVAGLAVSSWHVLVQQVPSLSGSVSCSATAPCSAALVEVFGLLTIPAMAACGFVAVLTLLLRSAPDPRLLP